MNIFGLSFILYFFKLSYRPSLSVFVSVSGKYNRGR